MGTFTTPNESSHATEPPVAADDEVDPITTDALLLTGMVIALGLLMWFFAGTVPTAM